MKQGTQPLEALGAEKTLDIDTPENVVFGYQIAGIGSRFLAALVDSILILILQVIVNMTLILLAATILGNSLLQAPQNSNIAWLAAVLGLVSFAFLWGYYIFFETLWNGQSPGKRWLGLRVIRHNGSPATFSDLVIRNLLRLVDFLPLYYGLGVITMFVDGQSRRLGDLAAGTVVVYESGILALDELMIATGPGMRTDQAARSEALPFKQLDADDVALASSFLRRRQDLHNRAQIAIEIAHFFRRKMSLPQHNLSEAEALWLVQRVAVQDHHSSPARVQDSRAG